MLIILITKLVLILINQNKFYKTTIIKQKSYYRAEYSTATNQNNKTKLVSRRSYN